MPISKVVFGNDTIIDITDTTAGATSVASGRFFYDSAGTKVEGIGSALGDEVVGLSAGGSAHFITGVDLTDDTVDASHLYTGYTAHDKNGIAITGTMVGPPLTSYTVRPDAELIKTYSCDKLFIADESGTVPAYSTTAKTLIATQNLSPTVSLTFADYNYYVVERFVTIPTYSIETKAKGRSEYHVASHLYEIAEMPANEFVALVDGTTKYTSRSVSVSASAYYRLLYWSSATAVTPYSTNAYGVYQAVTAPALSGSTLTLKTPVLGMRGHSSYFVQTFWDAITEIRFQYIIEIYRAPKNNYNLNGWGLYQNLQHTLDCALSSNHTLT